MTTFSFIGHLPYAKLCTRSPGGYSSFRPPDNPHFTDEEAEAQRGEVTCPGSHSWSTAPKSSVSKLKGHVTQSHHLKLCAEFIAQPGPSLVDSEFQALPIGLLWTGWSWLVGLQNQRFSSYSASKSYGSLGKPLYLLGRGSSHLGTGADNSFLVFSPRAVNYRHGWECL